MIGDQANVRRVLVTSLSLFAPLFDFREYHISLKMEASLESFFKALWWIFDSLNHRVFDVAILDNVLVASIFPLTFSRVHLMLITWFIEIYFTGHYDGLDREKQLKNCRHLWIPVLCGATSPSSKQRQANFSLMIEIWIESHSSSARCGQYALWWPIWIIVVKEEIIYETSMGIWSSSCSHYHDFHQVNSTFVHSAEHCICRIAWQGV